MSDTDKLFSRLDALLDRVDRLIPAATKIETSDHYQAYRWSDAGLEGSLQPQPDNVVIYATSKRRHLMPESMQNNLDSTMVDGQLHSSDSIEEKLRSTELVTPYFVNY